MSTDTPQEAKPKRRLGTGLKMVLGCGCGFLALLLIVCTVVLWQLYLAANAISNDPLRVYNTTQAITDIEIPTAFTSKGIVDIERGGWYFSGLQLKTFVQYYSLGRPLMLVMATIPPDANREQIELEMSLLTQMPAGQAIVETSREEITRTIRGKPATFTLRTGTFGDTKNQVYILSGFFPGKTDPAYLWLFAAESELSKAQVLKIVDSIK